jgi:ABC-type uncharacterized transport system permease subunit
MHLEFIVPSVLGLTAFHSMHVSFHDGLLAYKNNSNFAHFLPILCKAKSTAFSYIVILSSVKTPQQENNFW